MAKQIINIGTSANSGTGDPLRTAFTKANENFTELYNTVAGGTSGFSGFSGATGASGISGFSGASGISGFSGANGGNGNQLVSDENNNTFSITNDGNVVLSGEIPGGTNRGIVWDYGANINGGVNSMVRQDQNGLTVRAWSEGAPEPFSAPVNIVTNQGENQKTWSFDDSGVLTLPTGGIIAETSITNNPTIVIAPAQPDVESQVLFIKGGAPGYINAQNGISIQTLYNQYAIGDTASFNIWTPDNSNSTLYWWLEPAGGGAAPITPVSGTVLINEFGASDVSIDVEVLSTAPFRIYVGPTDGVTATAGISVSVNGETVVTDYHLHLTTGDLTETSIILGTDNHNVRTTTDGGIEINTYLYPSGGGSGKWTFDSNGFLNAPNQRFIKFYDEYGAENGIIGGDNLNHVVFAANANKGIKVFTDDGTKLWTFGTDGSLTLPGAVVKSTVAKTGGINAPTVSEIGSIVVGVGTTLTDNVPIYGYAANTPTGSATGPITALFFADDAVISPPPFTLLLLTPGIYTGFTVSSRGLIADDTNAYSFVVDGVSVLMTPEEVSPGANQYAYYARTGDVFSLATKDTQTLAVSVVYSDIPSTTTAIDLTKSVNKLADGAYTLADGVEGQIMYLVMQNGGTGNIQVFVDNARVGQGLYTNYPLFFNSGIITLIFTDGAWQQSGGGWD